MGFCKTLKGRLQDYLGLPTVGLDRIVSILENGEKAAYQVRGQLNVVSCCNACNLIKNTLLPEAFLQGLMRIAEHYTMFPKKLVCALPARHLCETVSTCSTWQLTVFWACCVMP